MSAGDRWHEHGPVKEADPDISPAVLLWMSGQASEQDSVPPWEVDPESAFRPTEPAPDLPESKELLDTLLRAIESTSVAAQFRNVLPLVKLAPPPPAHHQPADTAETAPSLPQPEPQAAPPDRASDDTPWSSEALAHLFSAIQNTEFAASISGLPEPAIAEPEPAASAPPAGIAKSEEALSALLPEPEPGPASPITAAAQSEALPSAPVENAQVAAPLEELALPISEKAEPIAPAPETIPAAELPVSAPSRAAGRQLSRRQKRAARRRAANRERSDYLLSIAAPPALAPESQSKGKATPAPPLTVFLAPAIPEETATAEPRPPQAAAETTEQPLTVFLAPAILPLVPAVTEPAKPAAASESAPAAEPLAAAPTPSLASPEPHPSAGPTSLFTTFASMAPVEGAASIAPVVPPPAAEKNNFAATGGLINGGLDRAELQLQTWFQKWFGPPDPRHAARVARPPLVAYHWIVDAPQALKVANISAGGLYLVTKERWSEGNIVSMTLQRTDQLDGSPESWIAVDFLVLRWCQDGMAGAFIASVPGLIDAVAGRAGNTADKKSIERFVERLLPPGQA
jgi:hypothetical protein